ncbi:hypothetical protein O3P69_015126 [Scylla paramamosain]|uniref:Uncharacterized protein n=1 Tax=Scylla paramamosain TaxID=85552 RepID=A0AAW0T3E4_SCYPA
MREVTGRNVTHPAPLTRAPLNLENSQQPPPRSAPPCTLRPAPPSQALQRSIKASSVNLTIDNNNDNDNDSNNDHDDGNFENNGDDDKDDKDDRDDGRERRR